MTTLDLAPRDVVVDRVGAAVYLTSPLALREPPRRLGDLLRRAAERAPDRAFLVEPLATGLRQVTYGEALRAAQGIASWLLCAGRHERPVLALSGNSIDHALLMLGCFLAGVPFVPVSAAYSLVSTDLARVRHIAAKIRPRVVFAEPAADFARALGLFEGADCTFLDGAGVRAIASGPIAPQQRAREDAVTADDVAKILFTSGSTGFPKGVPNTHRMLTSNQQMIEQLWPFLGEEPPVLVDWLPWSHTFGANHNLNLALFHAGTFFIDPGRPSPALLPKTLASLRACSPTLYFNVPAGFAALVPRLEEDESLCRAFFARLKVLFYAAAALPDDLWQRLEALAARSCDHGVFLTTAWGSTETSPLSTSAYFPLPRAGNIGLPAPGVTLKLVPNGQKLEVRVRGPHVMQGYYEEPELTRAAFDEEGFYRIGDAVRFADPEDPSRGLLFDGRVSEDFKLMTGTWVNVSFVRQGVLAAAAPALTDLVLVGQDRAELSILAWPSRPGCEEVVRAALSRWNAAHPESSGRIARALLLDEPPSLDAGEVTDKGYINQRAVLERRGEAIARLLAASPDRDVLDLTVTP